MARENPKIKGEKIGSQNWDPSKNAFLVEAFKEGNTMKQLASMFGVSPSTCFSHLKEMGYTRNSWERKILETRQDEVFRLFDTKTPKSFIARIVGVSKHRLKNFLSEHNRERDDRVIMGSSWRAEPLNGKEKEAIRFMYQQGLNLDEMMDRLSKSIHRSQVKRYVRKYLSH